MITLTKKFSVRSMEFLEAWNKIPKILSRKGKLHCKLYLCYWCKNNSFVGLKTVTFIRF